MRQIFVECCGECPYFNEGEFFEHKDGMITNWTDDSCLKGYGKISDKTKILDTCKLSVALSELM